MADHAAPPKPLRRFPAMTPTASPAAADLAPPPSRATAAAAAGDAPSPPLRLDHGGEPQEPSVPLSRSMTPRQASLVPTAIPTDGRGLPASVRPRYDRGSWSLDSECVAAAAAAAAGRDLGNGVRCFSISPAANSLSPASPSPASPSPAACSLEPFKYTNDAATMPPLDGGAPTTATAVAGDSHQLPGVIGTSKEDAQRLAAAERYCPRFVPSLIAAHSDGTFTMRTGPHRGMLAARIVGPALVAIACAAAAAFLAAALARDKDVAALAVVVALLLAGAVAAAGVALHAVLSPLTATHEAWLDPAARTVTVAAPMSALRALCGAEPGHAGATVVAARDVSAVLVREVGCSVDCLFELRLRSGESRVFGSRLTGCLAAGSADVNAVANWWRKSLGAMRGRRVKRKEAYNAV